MRTAVSIPDDVFKKADKLAKRKRKTRSQLYSDAVREYVLRHAPGEITKAMNRVIDQVGNEVDPFLTAAARRTFERNNDW
ncbi:MAG TPA: hypothetical protein VKS01_05615 [Bryobacteraceae bacterium]|nr:hypothetical protein [Bryobacteraceae bacterium]